MKRGNSQIAIDEQNVVNAVARQAHGQVCRYKTLAFPWHTARNKNGLQRSIIASLVDVGTETPELLHACSPVRERRKGLYQWLPRIFCNILERDLSLDHRLLLHVRGDPRFNDLNVIWNRQLSPLKIRPLKCFMNAAHSSMSFKESAESAAGLMLL